MSPPPILFLIFNRPDTTARVFEAIRAAQPARLYVAADGPRADRPGEAERCAEVRRIATAVDWPCEVKVLFRDQNLGCRRAVFEAISWFFQNEPEGIILEDDVLPDETFFPYCAELLERYRDDPRVMAICGGGYGSIRRFEGASYTFARVFDAWGWATWRRAWQKHDGAFYGLHKFKRQLSRVGPIGFNCRSYWMSRFEGTEKGLVSAWDYPWMFTIFKEGGLVVYPVTNLISNLGFREDATHTRVLAGGERPHLAEMPTSPLTFPMVHPQVVGRNMGFEVDLYNYRLFATRRLPTDILRRIISPHVPAPLKAWIRARRVRSLASTSN